VRDGLVLYRKRPAKDHATATVPPWALRIQRLEGSRPEGRLCTLNGGERVQSFEQAAVIGMICRIEVRLERRSVAQKSSA
jgi:hypothetical protein